MCKNQGLLQLLVVLVFYPIVVFSFCELRFSENPPLLVRSFGSRKVIQNNLYNQGIDLSPGEVVEAYCSGNLFVKNQYSNWENNADDKQLHSATFQCTSDGIEITTYADSIDIPNYEYIDIKCSSRSVKLYESNETLPNCQNYMSYGIGIRSLEDAQLTAAICYDLDTLSIKYVKNMIYGQKYSLLPTKHNLKENNIISLDTELNNFNSFFSFMSAESFLQSYRKKQSKNMLLENQEFYLDSLTQDKDLFNYVDSFNNIFKIIWWRNLLKGNWNFFTEALRDRIENVTYMAYTGVSETLNIPSLQSCKDTEIFEINANDKTIKAPAYIYTYLQSMEPTVDEDFVVIAYNTPYYAVDKSTQFCKDICDEIDWLKNKLFGKTHLMPVFGVMVCCRPEDVANKLENFPYIKNNKISTSTQPPSRMEP